jgi:SAM-dependent methyltransferase
MSVGENDAKVGVAGYTDEAQFAATANTTLAMLRRTVGIRATDTVLEIGAGVGRVGQVLAPLCKEWIGADVSENMLSHLRRRLKHLPNVRTVALNGYDLGPVADASIDLVYCTVVFMHLEEWERYRYVREAFRVLRPGGRLLVDNCTIITDEGWAMFEGLLALDPLARPTQVSKTSTPQELEVYFRRAGFKQIGQELEGLWVITHGGKPG